MKKFGLLGKSISYSFSPALHNKIFETYNFEGVYNLIDLDNPHLLGNLVNQLKKQNYLGINVTIPYKTEILKYVDFISQEVEEIGTANCIKFENNKLIAYNTDYFGLLTTFNKMNLNLKNKKVVVLGSGGASKTVVKALVDSNAIVSIISRDIELAKLTFPTISIFSYKELNSISGYLIINATPVGTFPDVESSPVDSSIIQNFDFVLDLIYNPQETLFLREARQKGKIGENGFCMLVAQGVKSQEIWNKTSYNYEKIYEDLLPFVYRQKQNEM